MSDRTSPVYGFTRDGISCWFKNKAERDEMLKEEVRLDTDGGHTDHPVPSQAFMTSKQFDALPEFDGW